MLFRSLLFCTYSKGQNKSDLTKDTTKSEIKDVISSHGPKDVTRTTSKIEMATFGLLHLTAFFDTTENRFLILLVK